MVRGISAAVQVAFESVLPAEAGELPRPEMVAPSRAADGPLLPRRTPLAAVPDDPGREAAVTALLNARARASDAGPQGHPGEPFVQAPDLGLLAQVLRGLQGMDLRLRGQSAEPPSAPAGIPAICAGKGYRGVAAAIAIADCRSMFTAIAMLFPGRSQKVVIMSRQMTGRGLSRDLWARFPDCWFGAILVWIVSYRRTSETAMGGLR